MASKLLSFIEDGISKSHGKDYAFSDASNIVRKASQEAAKAIASDVHGSGQTAKNRKTRVALDLAKKVGEEVIEAINEDIEIQTGSGLRKPSDGKPKKPRKPPVLLSKEEAAALDGKFMDNLFDCRLDKPPFISHLSRGFLLFQNKDRILS